VGRLSARLVGTRRALPPLVSLLAVSLVVSACTSTNAGRATTTTTTAAGPTTSVVPVTIPGTLQTGALASLGAVSRLPVMPVPAGRTSVDLPVPGSPGFAQVVQIAYRQLGSGPPLLLIAGEDASMSWWPPPLLQGLAQRYSVTVFDLPGVGYSGPARGRVSVQWLGDVTAGLVGELQLRSPTVLGWGLGGQVAVALAERHPRLVGALVLDDSGLPVGGSTSPLRPATRLLTDPGATLAEVSSLLFSPSQQAIRAEWLRELAAEPPDVVTAPAVTAEARLEAECWGSDALASRLHGIDVPTLVIGGSADAVFPPEDGAALAAAIPGAQYYLVEGGGYGDLLGDPPQVVATIEGFTG
jgi:pimeloyl-ACP methyl ester carboxylesterase